jgi:hypothetical protein
LGEIVIVTNQSLYEQPSSDNDDVAAIASYYDSKQSYPVNNDDEDDKELATLEALPKPFYANTWHADYIQLTENSFRSIPIENIFGLVYDYAVQLLIAREEYIKQRSLDVKTYTLQNIENLNFNVRLHKTNTTYRIFVDRNVLWRSNAAHLKN